VKKNKPSQNAAGLKILKTIFRQQIAFSEGRRKVKWFLSLSWVESLLWQWSSYWPSRTNRHFCSCCV